MPIEITLVPAKRLIFNNERTSRHQDERDIQAIRVFKVDDKGDNPTKHIIGSDIFQLEEKYQEEMYEKSRRNQLNLVKNPHTFPPYITLKPCRVRKIEGVIVDCQLSLIYCININNKEFASQIRQSAEKVFRTKHGCSDQSTDGMTPLGCAEWAVITHFIIKSIIHIRHQIADVTSRRSGCKHFVFMIEAALMEAEGATQRYVAT